MTSHPKDMTDSLIECHGKNKKLMPFLHLPIQSGSDSILEKMNRKHGVEQYYAIINKLKNHRPDIALSSDFIVGFPGETNQDFDKTMKFIEKIYFAIAYSVPLPPGLNQIEITYLTAFIRIIFNGQNIIFSMVGLIL